uniref:Uncharacterized protein n=1 Tax=Anguilla anguilla TaxID=7936 RepID=A0A0E9T3L6_ANGAN
MPFYQASINHVLPQAQSNNHGAQGH